MTIVVPVCALLWLGIQSFDRQRQALASLRAEKLEAAIVTRAREAANRAFQEPRHPLARHFFTMVGGALESPALRAPLPTPVPDVIGRVEQDEMSRPEAAIAAYRSLSGDARYAALALQGLARTLARRGRADEAKRTWRELATRFPDVRDPAGRPYGIVAAIQAGDTSGLLEQIASLRWDLSADQAEFFVEQLGPGKTEVYLDRFRFGREIAEQFRPVGQLLPHEIHVATVGGRRVFFRSEGADRIRGFAADPTALADLEWQVRNDLGMSDPETRDLRLHAGAIAVVSLLLLAGVVLLVSDTSREARTNALRAEFVSGVSHELKTPIALVRLYGETLLRHRDLPDAERRDFYRIITRESARLGRLVDQVLAFSRLERGALRYEMQSGDLALVVRRVLDDYEDWLEHAGFAVRRDVPTSVPPVPFDPAAVAQAMVNLLDNAVKYSGQSRDIAVRLVDDASAITLEVEDHGVGIASAEQARIFERFYRARHGTGKGGYGLGLFMVRHIMEAHGGVVELDSAPGRGSRFRLVFPRAIA